MHSGSYQQMSSKSPYVTLLVRRLVLAALEHNIVFRAKKGKRKIQGVLQLQTVALHRHQEEEETDKTKQAQIEQTY